MSATIRENLLTTMALYAGELSASNKIELPFGNEGEDALADFCAESVDRYLTHKNESEFEDLPFCDFAERKLMERFGKKIYIQGNMSGSEVDV